MLRLHNIFLFVFLCITTPSGSNLGAITWEFTEEEAATTSPWTAWEGWFNINREIYQGRIEGGSWIIDIPEIWSTSSSRVASSLEMLSPIIGQDSALFDQVRLRIRFVTDTPFKTGSTLAWTNSILTRPGRGLTILFGDRIVVDGSWQELTFDLRESKPDTWVGELQDIRLIFLLGSLESDKLTSGRVVRSVEVDRITLTGVEEQIRGELGPPSLAESAISGKLFEGAQFTSLGVRGIGESGRPWGAPVATLNDFNGDGALDLASPWWRIFLRGGGIVEEFGWVAVEGDGQGGFLRPWTSEVQGDGIGLLSGDVDGDGSSEVFVGYSWETQLLQHRHGTWEPVKKLEGVSSYGVADGDADGDVDLLAVRQRSKGPFAGLMVNDGTGRFEAGVDLRPSQRRWLVRDVANACGVGRLGALWDTGTSLGLTNYAVTCLQADGEVAESRFSSRVPYDQVRYAGDIDGDRDTDLVADQDSVLVGLLVLRNAGDGTVIEDTLDARARVRSVQVADLNLDGRSDLLFVDGSVRSPALVVYAGREGGRLASEGRYALEGRGTEVMVGDLNGDGWPDAVVLEPAARQTGGVYTFLNRGFDSSPTNVAWDKCDPEDGAGPEVAVYPNPFNSSVAIRLGANLTGDRVSMSVYNTAGQQVRSLVRGPIPAGTHEILWDGSTDEGEPVSSGVYFLRVETGRRSIVSKMLVAR